MPLPDGDGAIEGRADHRGVGLVDDDPAADVVIVGGALAVRSPEFSYEALNRAFASLRSGARLVAMHRTMYWRTDKGLIGDLGG